jgi:mRNA-degrading endonuclease RelE of RelBE toxin-antitoxin system
VTKVAIEYELHISKEVAGRLGRYRAPVRTAIRDRLREIAVAAGKLPARSKRITPKEPPLRFYVYDGYRVFYQVDAGTRRVVVLDLGRVAT